MIGDKPGPLIEATDQWWRDANFGGLGAPERGVLMRPERFWPGCPISSCPPPPDPQERSRPLTRQEYVNAAPQTCRVVRHHIHKNKRQCLKGLNKMLKDSYRQSAEVIMHHSRSCRRKQMITGGDRLCLAAKKALFCSRDAAEASLEIANSHKQG